MAGLVSASPGEGRPEIAHRFIGGNGMEEAPESRQGRKKCQGRKMILPSLAGLVPQPPENPALKRWAIVGRPGGTEAGASSGGRRRRCAEDGLFGAGEFFVAAVAGHPGWQNLSGLKARMMTGTDLPASQGITRG